MEKGDVILGKNGRMCLTDAGKIIVAPRVYRLFVIDNGNEYDIDTWSKQFMSIHDIGLGGYGSERYESIYKKTGTTELQDPTSGYMYDPSVINENAVITDTGNDLHYFDISFPSTREVTVRRTGSHDWQFWSGWGDGVIRYLFDFEVKNIFSQTTVPGTNTVSSCSVGTYPNWSVGKFSSPTVVNVSFGCGVQIEQTGSASYDVQCICEKEREEDRTDWNGVVWLKSIKDKQSFNSYEKIFKRFTIPISIQIVGSQDGVLSVGSITTPVNGIDLIGPSLLIDSLNNPNPEGYDTIHASVSIANLPTFVVKEVQN